MLCRYSSRAARDTKHWPQAKTNYNGLHSPRNAFYPGLTLRSQRGTASHTSSLSSTSMWSTFRSSDDANRFLSYLLRFVSRSSRLLARETRSASNRIKEIRDGRMVREGTNEGKTKKRQRGTGICTIRAGEISILIESASFGRLFSSAERRICVRTYLSVPCKSTQLTGLRASSSC